MVPEKGIPESQFAANRGMVAWLFRGSGAYLRFLEGMRRLRLSEAFNRPLLLAMVALWLLAAVIALLAALIGMTPVVGLVPVFLLGALGTARRWRWALALDFLVVAFSAVGVVGSAVELARGGADKASQLAPLGVSPLYAALLNLVFSLAAAVVFGWMVVRLRALR